MEKTKFSKNINIKNRKASFEYHFLDKFVAGMMLKGSEIKSIRLGKASLAEAFCFFDSKGGLWVKQMHISPYQNGTHENHEAMRERKLLLSKKELTKLQKKLEEKGLTIIPIRLFINEKGLAKLEIALAKGKKLYDKREDLKEKDAKREMARVHKY